MKISYFKIFLTVTATILCSYAGILIITSLFSAFALAGLVELLSTLNYQ